MLITYNADRKRFESRPVWSERKTANPALKHAGFWFDWENRVWYALQPQVAAKLADYLDEGARARVSTDTIKVAAETVAVHAHAQEDSRAVEADIEIPVPSGLAYLPYQKAGIAYALRKFGDI